MLSFSVSVLEAAQALPPGAARDRYVPAATSFFDSILRLPRGSGGRRAGNALGPETGDVESEDPVGADLCSPIIGTRAGRRVWLPARVLKHAERHAQDKV
jgi:hypothetical protein